MASNTSGTTLAPPTSVQQPPPTIKDRTFAYAGNLVKLLPTGTVFVYQFLAPLLTNYGNCTPLHKYLTAALLFLCAFACCFSCFTDCYTGADGRHHYGLATAKGLWVFLPEPQELGDLSVYRLRVGDFVHAGLALVVCVVVAVMDHNTPRCYYPSFQREDWPVLMYLPTGVGAMASFVFMVFPNKRNGIGYPPSRRQNSAM